MLFLSGHTTFGGIMVRVILSSLCALLFISGCTNPPANRAVVAGANPELLKLRAGPGLGYNVILGLPDGTVVLRRDCTTEVGQLWCRVSLAAAPGVTGFVSADYLSPRP
jgi:uncharacterized protein YraI